LNDGSPIDFDEGFISAHPNALAPGEYNSGQIILVSQNAL